MTYEPADSYLASDTPIDGDERPDLFEREWFAEQVARRIAQAGTGDSVVFGLAGPWGAGKTSTLNLIRKTLDHDAVSAAPWRVVEFTPWAVDDAYGLAEEFYNTIASALDDKPGGKEAVAKKMLNAAAPALAAGGKALLLGLSDRVFGKGTTQESFDAVLERVADSAGDLSFKEDPFAARFGKISDLLEGLELRMLVIVDDVDRLHHDELLAVMKAVRLLGRFKGVHYLLSYDTQTVTDVLTRSDLANGNRRRAEQYLEKIVQFPFQLPPIQDIHLASVIDERLRELTQRGGYPTDRGERDLEVLLSRLPLDHLTLRTVHRLFAQVDMMLALITEKDATSRPCDEIDLLDAILITYLRLEHHDFYRQLSGRKADLTYQAGAFANADKAREREQELRQKILDTVPTSSGNLADTQRAFTVLRALFPDALPRVDGPYLAVPREAQFQVREPIYFDRYFVSGFPAKDIRDRSIRDSLVELIQTGELPPDSVLRAYANDSVRGSLLRAKIRHTIAAAVDQTTDHLHCGTAAIVLTSLTSEQERLEPHFDAWWAAVSFHLWHALETNQGVEASRKALADYMSEFGTAMTATAIHIGRPSPDSPLRSAAEIVWDRIHDAIVDTLLDNRPDMPDPNPAIRFMYWLEQYPLLRQHVQATIEQRTTDPDTLDLIGIAARLIEPMTLRGSNRQRLSTLSIDTLTMLVPYENWPANQLPEHMEPNLDLEDLSYPNRRKIAANTIRASLGTPPEHA